MARSGDQFSEDLPGFDESIGPDLTDSILGRVESERGFVAAPKRRRITAGRVFVAAGLLAVVGGVAAVHRAAPWTAGWTLEASPVSGVIEASRQDAAAGVASIREATGRLAPAMAERNVIALPYIPSSEELAFAGAQAGTRTLGAPTEIREDVSDSGTWRVIVIRGEDGSHVLADGSVRLDAAWTSYLPCCSAADSVSDVGAPSLANLLAISERLRSGGTETIQLATDSNGYLP